MRPAQEEERLREVKKERLQLKEDEEEGARDADFWEELKVICSLPPLSPLSPYPHFAFPQLSVVS
ncbi:hypothetical protein TRIUR3_34405 [Triticum urartu]|nr:hypothetical protein TRIUR3_34405 [Triticum urartu]